MIPYWSAHSHSRFSAKDALPKVEAMVDKAVELGYPALGLTDHGNTAGAVRLYNACRKADIEPLPGIEAYLAVDRLAGKRPTTMHAGFLATSEQGYRNLVRLVTEMNRNFRYKPVLDFADLAKAHEAGALEGLAMMSGCWFGMLPELLRSDLASSALRVRNVLLTLAEWFGDRFFVEIQTHGIRNDQQDDELHAALLYGVAQKHGLPVVITQDSHYVRIEDRPVHDTLKMLISWNADDPDSAVFPGDGYHMVDGLWMRAHHEPEIYAAGMEGLEHLYNQAKVRIPELDTFRMVVPHLSIGMTPEQELTERCTTALATLTAAGRIRSSSRAKYKKRLAEELDVINGAGFAGYMLFVAAVTSELRERAILFNIRGSAAGSLVCYLLQITDGVVPIDPIFYDLSFARFLSRDRSKPPDVDIDVAHNRRQEIVDWLTERYHVLGISTWSQLKLDDQAEAWGSQAGSLMVLWKQYQGRTGGDRTAIVPKHEWARLRQLSDMKAFAGYGVHPAGLLVTSEPAELEAMVPQQWVASSGRMVSAYDMEDVGATGLVKLDLLGLKMLTALDEMIEISGVAPEDANWRDPEVYKAFGRGKTVGVFQLDGYAAQKGITRMRPTKMSDVIAAMALFRPATMTSGAMDAYLERRSRLRPIETRHPIIAEETAETYGVMLYQEQAISIMQRLGLAVEDIEAARKAVKASNAGVGKARAALAEVMDRVREHAAEHGMNAQDVVWLENGIRAYAEYGFNRAHATSYGLMAYLTGWYSVRHPVAFWTGMLNANIDDEKRALKYLKAARNAGVRVLPPHINRSAAGYTPEAAGVRKGLQTIKGVGEKAASDLVAKAPWASLDDLASRANGRTVTGSKALGRGHTPAAAGGVITILHAAGALHGIEREDEKK